MKSTFKSLFICAMTVAIAMCGSFAFADTGQRFTAEMVQTQALTAQDVAVEQTVVTDTAVEVEAQKDILVAPAIICRPGPVAGSPTPRICQTVEMEVDTVELALLERYDKLYF